MEKTSRKLEEHLTIISEVRVSVIGTTNSKFLQSSTPVVIINQKRVESQKRYGGCLIELARAGAWRRSQLGSNKKMIDHCCEDKK